MSPEMTTDANTIYPADDSAVYPDVAPFATWLGLATESVGDGNAVLTLVPRPELLNRRGVVHGGVIATMLDSAMARASRTIEGVQELSGTTDLHVQYMQPAEGTLRVHSWVEHAAGTLAFCRAEIHNDNGELVAAGTASLKIRRRPTGTPL